MKPLLDHALACLLLLSALCSCAAVAPKDRALASVDGALITDSQFRGAMALQEMSLQPAIRSDPQKRAEAMAKLKRPMYNFLIDQQLLVNEFNHMRAILKAEYLDQAILDFIKDHFHGDRAAFQNWLNQRDLSLAQFRNSMRLRIINRVMLARIAGEVSSSDKLGRERITKKIKELWEKATIKKLGSW
jgi:SurA N-terminal domain